MRELAQRCSDTARETQDKVGAAVAAARSGVAHSHSVYSRLTGVLAKESGIHNVVTDISKASRSQREQIQMVDKAMHEISSASQSIASCAEESSASGAQLRERVNEIGDAVNVLLELVG